MDDTKKPDAEAIIACLEADAVLIDHEDMLPEMADNMLAARDLLESLLSGQPVEVPGCVVKMQLVPVSLHVDMIEAWSKLALDRIKNPDANKGFEASMHETYRAILAASAAMLTASASESGEGG